MINCTITLTSKADKDEAAIYKYIATEFGKIYADRFREKLIEFFHLLSKQPFIGRPAKNNPALRVYIFTRQNKVIYKVIDEEIVIIRLLNSKSNLASKY